jgi:hypothetical protein
VAGYRKKPKTYTLTWAEDHEYHGLEVSLKGLTVAKMLDIGRSASAVTTDAQGTLTEGTDETRDMFETFASCLVRWNLETEDGEPVPATFDGVTTQEFPFILDLVVTWMEAVAGTGGSNSKGGDSPLSETSSSGLAALEASLRMDPLSPSPAS